MKYIILLVTLAACAPSPMPSDPEPVITIKESKEDCAPGCAAIRKLKCPESENLVYPDQCKSNSDCSTGVCINNACTETCEMLCEAFIDQGRYLGAKCWETVSDCQQIELCRVK
jgi:hypothetical protein